MSDPSLAVQGAINTTLRNAGICQGRVYDRVPAKPTFPYVTIGEGDTVGDDNGCFDASEVNLSVHVWSRTVGFPEAKTIAGQIRGLLKTDFALPGFNVSVAEYVTTRYMRDPDGLTNHAVVEFRYLVDHDH